MKSLPYIIVNEEYKAPHRIEDFFSEDAIAELKEEGITPEEYMAAKIRHALQKAAPIVEKLGDAVTKRMEELK